MFSHYLSDKSNTSSPDNMATLIKAYTGKEATLTNIKQAFQLAHLLYHSRCGVDIKQKQ